MDNNCPLCGSKLIEGPLRSYETLLEHVSDPNEEDIPPRPTLICGNPECIACGTEFWYSFHPGDVSAFMESFGASFPPRLKNSAYNSEGERDEQYTSEGVYKKEIIPHHSEMFIPKTERGKRR